MHPSNSNLQASHSTLTASSTHKTSSLDPTQFQPLTPLPIISTQSQSSASFAGSMASSLTTDSPQADAYQHDNSGNVITPKLNPASNWDDASPQSEGPLRIGLPLSLP